MRKSIFIITLALMALATSAAADGPTYFMPFAGGNPAWENRGGGRWSNGGNNGGMIVGPNGSGGLLLPFGNGGYMYQPFGTPPPTPATPMLPSPYEPAPYGPALPALPY